ncbi:MAG: HU family DNA-binding protein [Elainellaceae cyanobacterium]
MNKKDLIEAIAGQADGVTKRDIDAILSATLEVIMRTVATGEVVKLVGFGTFEARDRKAREGRNPRTGESLTIPASRVPAFSAGQQFKDEVKHGDA